MKPIISSLVLVASFCMAHVAFAQQARGGDVEYCRSMAQAYLSQNPAQEAPTAGDATLLDDCTRNTSGTTALLKEKLASHGIDMPKPALAGALQ